MPPKKEKKEQFTGDQASEMMLEYLTQQNRPYSAADISSNLHNAVTKATATKVLKEMHESGLIEGRVAGKQIVYHAIQSTTEGASGEDLKVIDEQIESIKQETAALKARIGGIKQETAALKTMKSVADLTTAVASIEVEVSRLEDTLKTLHASAIAPVDPIKAAAAQADYTRIEKVYKLRQRQFRDFWMMVCDGIEDDPAELWERIGLDGEMVRI